VVPVLARSPGITSEIAKLINEQKAGTRNWVFLGDSLTEGIGSQRHSHVTELVTRLREGHPNGGPSEVHLMRMRRVDPKGFDRFINFNMAGFLDSDDKVANSALWVWNLACEGQTIDTDGFWLPFLTNLRPELIVLFRGSLESIIRPAMLRDNSWPWWVPNGWRGYAAMDPRCYFSSTSWRRTKQAAVDGLKQTARQKLLSQRPGQPLMDAAVLVSHYEDLLTKLQTLQTRILLLGLLAPDPCSFPCSPEQFDRVNSEIAGVAARREVEFLDWGKHLLSSHKHAEIFYRDGFHPNSIGSRLLANILVEYLSANKN